MAAAAGLARGAGGRWVAVAVAGAAGVCRGGIDIWLVRLDAPASGGERVARHGGLGRTRGRIGGAVAALAAGAVGDLLDGGGGGRAVRSRRAGRPGSGSAGVGPRRRSDSGGVSVDGGGVRLSLGGLAVGRAGRLRPLAAVAPRARGDRVVYARGSGVSEWYAAGPLGLEQGFTLSRRPAGRSGAVTLALALGGLPARMSGQPESSSWRARGGWRCATGASSRRMRAGGDCRPGCRYQARASFCGWPTAAPAIRCGSTRSSSRDQS